MQRLKIGLVDLDMISLLHCLVLGDHELLKLEILGVDMILMGLEFLEPSRLPDFLKLHVILLAPLGELRCLEDLAAPLLHL